MRKLLNTLYITNENSYLKLDGENIIIFIEKDKHRFPLCNFEEIVCFNYKGCSPQLMAKCASLNISLTFLTSNGKLEARVIGKIKGNIYTRIAQIDYFRDKIKQLKLIQNCIAGKLINTKYNLSRTRRDYPEVDEDNKLSCLIDKIGNKIKNIFSINDINILRGIEGEIAKNYFAVFNRFFRNTKFSFNGRNKRPPLDEINCVLSFVYSMQANSITSALETAGIDAYYGYYHTLRSGRASLSLDILEEFRAIIDRFIITIFNLNQLDERDFENKVSGAVLLNDGGRKKVIKLWQEKKKENIFHPFLEQKIPYGLLPFAQANIFGKFLRGEITEYVPFILK